MKYRSFDETYVSLGESLRDNGWSVIKKDGRSLELTNQGDVKIYDGLGSVSTFRKKL